MPKISTHPDELAQISLMFCMEFATLNWLCLLKILATETLTQNW